MNGNGLTSLLYFLAFGLFFYWMMKKGGCGMHGRGGHGGHDKANNDSADPDARHSRMSGSTAEGTASRAPAEALRPEQGQHQNHGA